MSAPEDKKLSANEGIKIRSNFLRGTILEGLADPVTGAISDDDGQLTKFHASILLHCFLILAHDDCI